MNNKYIACIFGISALLCLGGAVGYMCGNAILGTVIGLGLGLFITAGIAEGI